MKRKRLALFTALFLGSCSTASAQGGFLNRTPQANNSGPILRTSFGLSQSNKAPCDAAPADCGCEPACGCEEPACGCEEPACGCEAPACGCEEPACGCEASCGCEEPVCGCETSCGCEEPACGCESGCDGGCAGAGGGGGGGGGFLAKCLSDCHDRTTIGGWMQLGYHSAASNFRFNNYDDGVRLHQAYLYWEEAADGSKGLSFGKRIDYVYGIDAPDTQAFGQDGGWDTEFDHGEFYGHAIPQAYGVVAYGDTEVKIGHFYTLIGYEVVTATGNFFYSHSYTMYNSEPFTHTGALVTHKASDELTLYGGYVLGWDSGFEDNGDAFLGGATASLTSDVSVTYAAVAGRFNETDAGGFIGANERGYMHSLITTLTLTDKLQYVFWTDYLSTEDEAGDTIRDTFDITNYLIYQVSDCLSLGTRAEWWNVKDTLNGGNSDVYVLTVGANVRANDHFVVRPEVRWDWDRDQLGVNEINPATGLASSSQAAFGIDAIFSF